MLRRGSALSGHAIICGAGIGGLSAALALHARGWSVQVIEQAEELREVGAGLQLSPNACKVLQALDVLPELDALSFAPQALEMRLGRSGQSIFRIALQAPAAARWNAPYLHLHRADLLQVLTQSLMIRVPGALRLNARLEQLKHSASGVEVKLSCGQRLHGDLLIGADGIHSRVREILFGPDRPRFTGHVAWRAVAPVEALGQHRPPPSACVWTGPQRHAVTYRLRGGALANFVGVIEQAHWERESWHEQGPREQVLADFAGWHPIVTRLIESAAVHHRWALFDRPPLTSWQHRHCVLLGDACHPMLPFMAQGAAMAIEDAWALASSLDATAQISPALARYESWRKPRTSRVQAASRANAKVFHLPAPAYWPLWLLARLWPDFFHRRQDWLYAYDVTDPTSENT